MNIVDVLKQQLGGEVAKTLGGMAGASEGDLSKIIGSALPGLLSGLGSLASSKDGAGKIADAIGGMDSSLFGNLAGMLGGAVASKGGGMLSGLFGAGLVDNIAGAISKFTGVNQGVVKMVLGYLTPVILGSIGKSLGGAKPDASSISRFFTEQKSNIDSSIPSGFSLKNIQGFSSLAGPGGSTSSRPPAPAAPAPSGGLGTLLIPAILLAVLAGGYLYWKNQEAQKVAKVIEEKASQTVKEATESAMQSASEVASKATGVAEEMTKKVADATKSIADAASELPKIDLDSLKGDFTSMFDGLTGKLGEVADAAGAEAILPDLKEYAAKLDGLSKTVTALPGDGKSIIVELVKSQLDKINPILEKITGIPGLAETVLQVIEQIKAKLSGLVS